MAYTIDKTLSWANVINFTSDSGTKYSIRLSETTIGSGMWTLEFNLVSGEPSNSEVFSTMSKLYEILTEKDGLLEKNNANNIIIYIAGRDREEVNKKTSVFTRWIRSPWEYKIDYQPEVIIQGRRDPIYPDTNFIHMTKNQNLVETVTVTKFCFNCGAENKDYKFCPSCGQNLQQA